MPGSGDCDSMCAWGKCNYTTFVEWCTVCTATGHLEGATPGRQFIDDILTTSHVHVEDGFQTS